MSITGKNEEILRQNSEVILRNGTVGGPTPAGKTPNTTRKAHGTMTSPPAPSKQQSHHPAHAEGVTFLQIDNIGHRISATNTRTNQLKTSQLDMPGSKFPMIRATSKPLTLASERPRDAQNVRKSTIAPSKSGASLRLDERRGSDNNSTTRRPTDLPSAPPSTASILTLPEDFKFALRQTKIESMKPDEREKQEIWAQSLIQRSGVCPEGYNWNRMDGGYQCVGGGHGMTDEIIAEGKAGLLAVRTKKWGVWDGPWYPNPDGKGFVKGTGYKDEHRLSK